MDRSRGNGRDRSIARFLGVVLGRPLIGPQWVSLEVTHHCNLRCTFCESHGYLLTAPITAHRNYVHGRTTMDLETVRELARDLASLRTDLVELSGKGDPITHPDVLEIVSVIKAAGLRCSLVTNGTLAGPELARAFVAAKLDRLSVSLNAGTAETYHKVNRRDLWGAAVGFLGDVMRERQTSGGREPWIRTTHVIFQDNFDEMEKIVLHSSEMGVDEVNFVVMGELPETNHLQLDRDAVSWITSGIDHWSRQLDDAGIVHNLRQFERDIGWRVNPGSPQGNPLQEQIPCYEGWFFAVIAPDGVVTPCCYCEEQNLGNVHERCFKKVWTGRGYREYRRASMSMPKTRSPLCVECFTTCNRAVTNRRIHDRCRQIIRPISRRTPASASAETAP